MELSTGEQGANTDDFGGDGSEGGDMYDDYQDAMAEQAENVIRNQQSIQQTVQQQFTHPPSRLQQKEHGKIQHQDLAKLLCND